MITNILKTVFQPKEMKTAPTVTNATPHTKQPVYRPKSFNGFLKVTDFPELDHDGVSICILNKGTMLHHTINEDKNVRGPLMAKRNQMLSNNGWTKCFDGWSLGGRINVISMEFFEKLIETDLSPIFSQTFSSNSNDIGYIMMHKPTKDIYPPEYGAHLPIKQLEYSHKFIDKHMEFKFKAQVASNPRLPHYNVHAREFLVEFEVNKDDFVNHLFYVKPVGEEVWNAYKQIFCKREDTRS